MKKILNNLIFIKSLDSMTLKWGILSHVSFKAAENDNEVVVASSFILDN